MLTFLNGEFVPEERAVVSVLDRGFLYGDGLFETLRVINGKPFRWAEHMERLQSGAEFLGICLPFTPEALAEFAGSLITRNAMPDALLRLTVSRGVGLRGYSPRGADKPTVVMSLHAPPAASSESVRWRLVTSSHRLPANEKLARFKTCNKLAQILARAEADAAGADEALLLNTDDDVVEGASSNLFWIAENTICTPPLVSGVLPGVTREVVMHICKQTGLPAREQTITCDQLKRADGVFLSLSSLGIVEATTLDGTELNTSPLVKRLQASYRELLQRD